MITLSDTSKKEPVPALLKINEVAKLLSVSRHSVHMLIDSGDLIASDVNPTGKARKHRRITRESLLIFYKKRFGHELNRALADPFAPGGKK